MNEKIKQDVYYNKKDPIGRYLSETRNRIVLSHVKGRLLDLGCGDGQLVRNYAGEAEGVDIKDYGFANIIAEDFSDLPIEDKTYDTATIVASLNYFDEPVEVIKETRRIIKDDGQLILTMPNAMIMKIWHKIREPWARHPGFGRKVLVEILSDGGYKLETRRSFLFGLNNLYVFKKNEG